MEQKIFIGGCYSAPIEVREKIAHYGKRIEAVVKDCGYESSLNFLANKDLHKDVKSAVGLKFNDGRHFMLLGRKKIKSVSQRTLEAVRSLRRSPEISNEYFTQCYMANKLMLDELNKSVAGIFELSHTSQGSYLEIGLLIYQKQVPVLCLSHDDGRYFGKMLVGSPSGLLILKRYNDKNLEDVVRDFLITDLEKRKMRTFNIRVNAVTEMAMSEAVKQDGFDSVSELACYAVDKYLDERKDKAEGE